MNHGDIMLKKDAKRFIEMLRCHNKEIHDLLASDDNIAYETFVYEMDNHEYAVNWDDDYDESVSVKTWLRRKYTGPYRYRGRSEHFMEARTAVSEFCDDNRMMRVSPSFAEWMHMSEAEKENLQQRKFQQ